MNAVISSFYNQKAKEYAFQFQRVTINLKWFGWYRFFAFASVFAPFFIFGFKSWLALFISVAALVVFLYLVKKNIQLEKILKKTAVLQKIVSDELLALDHSFSHFNNGVEFLSTDHFFSYDLDLFGEGSLFQFVNRTSTISGKAKLAEWLIKPPLQKDEIIQRQEAIRELSQIPEWRLNFLAKGKMFEETIEMHNEVLDWAKLDLKLKSAGFLRWLILLIPGLTLISAVPAGMGIATIFVSALIFSQWVLFVIFWKRISEYFRFFGRKSEFLSKYMMLLQYIEDGKFRSDLLCKLQNRTTQPLSSGKIFCELKSLVKQLEYRENILVGFVLNSFLLWDIRCVYKLWSWHSKHYEKLAGWLNVISEMDALNSLSNYANNHPDFVFPGINNNGFTFSANGLGHPLLKKEKRVCNDFEIDGWSKAIIITGANMAGKSTFLRTVGVNLILARMGAPVCAGSMVFTPIEIYTNMRTTDSLLKEESYFFAELKRLKGVLDLLKGGGHFFVILDEMLKGTNSVDKLNGSKELLRKLVQFYSVSLIATHDLKLNEMENEFPGQVFNKCFEIRIENEDLIFDYRLTDGVTKTMNATFLMKKMGII